MKKNIKFLGIILISLFSFTSCSKEISKSNENTRNSYYPVDVEIIDDNGFQSTESIKNNPENIIVLGEALGEYMIAFGQEEKVIGLGYIDGENLSNSKLESMNLINKLWPSKESIISLNPDLIYSMSSGFKEDRIGNIDFWRQRNVNVIPAINFTVGRNDEEYRRDLINFGKVFNVEEDIKKFLYEENEKIDKYKNKVNKNEEILFLSISGGKYYYCPPKGAMINDVIENLGGKYIKLSEDKFIEVSKEGIIKANPDKIILAEFQSENKEKIKNEILNNKALKNVKAVENKDILVVDYTSAVRGNLEMSQLYKEVYEFLIKESDGN